MAGVLLGFDPGGSSGDGKFGWAVLADAPACPLRVLHTGVARSALDAEAAVVAVLQGEEVLSVGIDAPLVWNPAAGDRAEDTQLRSMVRQVRPLAPVATVNSVNSLRGACLVQGMACALLVSSRWSGAPITEAHPKASLWLRGLRPIEALDPKSLAHLVVGPSTWKDDERDAAIAALAAWAMIHEQSAGTVGWRAVQRGSPSLCPLARQPPFWV